MVGAGQLARMTWQSAISLGVDLRLLADSADDGAARVTPYAVVGSYLSYDDLERFAAGCDVVTFDHELVDPDILRRLEAAGHVLRPSPVALMLAQDKAHQRDVLGGLGL